MCFGLCNVLVRGCGLQCAAGLIDCVALRVAGMCRQGRRQGNPCLLV